MTSRFARRSTYRSGCFIALCILAALRAVLATRQRLVIMLIREKNVFELTHDPTELASQALELFLRGRTTTTIEHRSRPSRLGQHRSGVGWPRRARCSAIASFQRSSAIAR
jgi:hypothetical protein